MYASALAGLTSVVLTACTALPFSAPPAQDLPFTVTPVTSFEQPWAMTFLPDGRALVTQRPGQLLLVNVATGEKTEVQGAPPAERYREGGLGDVVLSPTFAQDSTIYLSWLEREGDNYGAVVGKGVLDLTGTPRITSGQLLWKQSPKALGGHFSHRLAFSPDGQHLYITSGDRQEMEPAQDLSNNLGSVVRLTLDGHPAPGNPFAERGGITAQVWSYGHRNALGIAVDDAGNVWSSEMGPKGGDEINLILPGRNYGWPRVSNGSHYDDTDIPDHAPGDGFEAPQVWWTPSVSPGSLTYYNGPMFPQWKGDLFAGALSGQALLRIDVKGTTARKGDQWNMGARIREVEPSPDGALWLLEDGSGGRLLKLTPRR